MDAVEYIKTIHRLCESQNGYSGCSGCPLLNEDDYCSIVDARERAEDVVQIVEQWAKDHPIKTRQSEFLKKFPNADLLDDVINITPCKIEKEMKRYCGDRACNDCRKDYWLTEVTDNGNVY